MLDIKTFKSALEQLEEERKIPKEKILDAIEQAMAAAYKKDYGKKGQIIRAKFDLETGKTDFFQVKIVVDETIAKIEDEVSEEEYSIKDENDERVRFNAEHHIMLEDAKKIKKDAELNDEIIFPLEAKEDYGRIAAQTAKQVIIQRIREAERSSVIDEYGTREGEIDGGIVQKIEKGNVYVDDWEVSKLPKAKIHELRRKVGTVFQDFKILTDRTVAENVGLILEILDLPDKEIAEKIIQG